jgi:hypothetical protein
VDLEVEDGEVLSDEDDEDGEVADAAGTGFTKDHT